MSERGAVRSVVLWGWMLSAIAAVALGDPAPPAGGAQPAKVSLFSPQGVHKLVRQVTARFSEPMVALGDPRLEDPFVIQCAGAGKGRWADSRNWVYDFDEDLPAGMRCQFRLRPGLRTSSGAAVADARLFEFSTGGPNILQSYPADGSRDIDEDQVFLLKLDGLATPASVEAHAWCEIEGIGEQVPVDVLAGEARAAVLRNRAKFGYQYYRILFKQGLQWNVAIPDESMREAEKLVSLVHCRRNLPSATRVTLHWDAGIAAESGLATTKDQALHFRTRDAFLAQVECERVNPRAGCLPFKPITVQFNAPVPHRLALGVRLRTADGRTVAPPAAPQPDDATVDSIVFPGPFPERSDVTVTLPAAFTDDGGRSLQNASHFPLTVRVDELPPLAKFSGTFGILEAGEGGVLPVTLRNVEPSVAAQQLAMPARLLKVDDLRSIVDWMHRVEKAEEPSGNYVEAPRAEPGDAKPRLGTHEEDGQDDADNGGSQPTRVWQESTGTASVLGAVAGTTSFEISKPEGSKPFEVIGIPLRQKGFYVVELESRQLGQALLSRDQPRYVSTTALVTNMAVHFKRGRESSLVWVTHLDDGSPVADAQLTLTHECDGRSLWHGTTGRDGTAQVPVRLPNQYALGRCNGHHLGTYVVSARKDDDFSFVLGSWDQGIQPYQFNLPVGSEGSTEVFHAVLDRPLFRAGETVSMKLFLRQHVLQGFAVPAGASGDKVVTIQHTGSDQSYQQVVRFDANGVGEDQWQIPKEAKLGTYQILLGDGRMLAPGGEFRVEEFRLPSLRASVTGPTAAQVMPKSVDIDLHVAYMSGGSVPGLAVKLRSVVEPQAAKFAGYEDYFFGGKPVTQGIQANVPAEDEEAGDEGAPASQPAARSQLIPLTLDANGSARISVPVPAKLEGPATLTAELEYADANGEILTSAGRVSLAPASIAVGVRGEGWVGSDKQVRFRVVVLGIDGKPRPSQAVHTALYQSQRFSYRKRLVGGFYSYETTTDTRRLAATCDGKTDAQGVLACEVAPGVAGEVLIRAEARDAAGRTAGATTSVWVVDSDSWWFGGTSGDRMDVLPERKSYEVGETARLQVRMPFQQATALVTVEREGVASSFVTTLRGNNPVVEVPILDHYAPDVFVSVLAVRGRVAHADGAGHGARKTEEVSALVDLRKPAFRLGIARVNVGWKPHRLDVSVTPERASYKVREKAAVTVHVARADGRPLPEGTEVAVAAVDGALLQLAPNNSWDLLAAMMGERGLEVSTATAQMQVVGKRHYGRKAVPSGGGGGRDLSRELFDTLLYWKARVGVDAAGNARVTVPLNDSLTQFRIVAIASGGVDLFGSGSASINTTQDLMLLSGLPPLVREGDQFLATVTVRNASNRPISATVRASLNAGMQAAQSLAPQHVDLAAGQSRDLSWPVVAPVGQSSARWEVSAQEESGEAMDRLRVTQAVIPAFPTRTYQATIASLDAPFRMPASRPAGAVEGRGGLDVTVRASLAGGLDGVREFMSLYPYDCIEQQLSQAVALRDRASWTRLMARLPAYLDTDHLLRYFPSDALPGDDALTAYVLAIANEAGWDIPDASRGHMIGALQGFVAGRIHRNSALPTADLTVRKLAAIEALARYDEAQPRMLDSLSIEPDLWPTSALLDWIGILDRVKGVANAAQHRSAALGILRARLNFQGTVMGFSTERTDALWWLMISADANANRLLLTVMREPEWRDDMARLVRGSLMRQHRGHWNTTVANAWGVLAMEKFSSTFESTPVTGTTVVAYAGAHRSVGWPLESGSADVHLPWSASASSLEATHDGTGAPWLMVRATAAMPIAAPVSSGFHVQRTVTAVERSRPDRWTRGDIVRVHLDLDAQSDMTWVVLDDPVPAGSSILGGGLGGQSALLTRGERRDGWAWPAFEERRFDAYRIYYRYVPKGKWSVDYTMRLNNPGTFLLPATRVEAMYAPEMFGELPNASLVVDSP